MSLSVPLCVAMRSRCLPSGRPASVRMPCAASSSPSLYGCPSSDASVGRRAARAKCRRAARAMRYHTRQRRDGQCALAVSSTMTKPKTTHFDTLSLHAGARPDPATGARATPIYQSASFVFPRQRPRRGAVQHGARGPRLFAHLQSDLRGARGAHRGARRRRRRDRHGERAGGAASGDRHADGRGLAHRRVARALRRLAQPARLHAAALRHRDDVRRPARSRCLARRDPARTRACCSARRSATRDSTCSTFRASRRSRTSTACRCSSIRRSPRRS